MTHLDQHPYAAVALFEQDLRCIAGGGALLAELGTGKDELIGQSLVEHTPTGVEIDVKSCFRRTLEGEPGSCEFELNNRQYLARTIPVWGSDDTVTAGLVLIMDITERKQYERELNEARERVEELTSVVSHDLQEPLRTITNYLQLLERRYEDTLDEDAEKFLTFARKGATRMRGMIDGLAADWPKDSSEQMPLETVDLDSVLEGVRTDLSRKIEEHSATITTQDLPQVEGDADQLHELLLNLLDNAIKYSGPDPPRVTVSAKRNGEFHIISVTDQGIGINKDNTEEIFEMFSRGRGSDVCLGSGIGLAQCQRIINRHGGEIWVDPEPGEETTFSFTLPPADGS